MFVVLPLALAHCSFLKTRGVARALFKLHYTCRDGSGPGWVFVSARLSVCVSVIYIYIYIHIHEDYIYIYIYVNKYVTLQHKQWASHQQTNTCESLKVMWTSMKIIGNHVKHMGTHVNIDENHIDIIDNHACCFASGSCSLPLLKNKGGRAHYSSCTIHAGMGVALYGCLCLPVCLYVWVLYIYIYIYI